MDLDAIEARAKAATPGPWSYRKNRYRENSWVISRDAPAGRSMRVIHYVNDPEDDQEHVDGVFVAHAREDIPALIAQLRRLSEDIEALRRGFTEYLCGGAPLVHGEGF
jgi:hypothetical protein